MRDSVQVGQVIWVPLRGKPALGVIARLHGEAPAFAVKSLLAPVDPPTRVSADQLDTAAQGLSELAVSKSVRITISRSRTSAISVASSESWAF